MNWIIVTIIAAFFQNLRSSFQKKINKDVSTIASTYVRFSFALPLALILFDTMKLTFMGDFFNNENFIKFFKLLPVPEIKTAVFILLEPINFTI